MISRSNFQGRVATSRSLWLVLALMVAAGLTGQQPAARSQDESKPAVPSLPTAAQSAPDKATNSSSQSGQAPQAVAPKVPEYFVPSEYAYFTAEKTQLPSYPPEAAANKIGGDVVLLVAYSTEGSVSAIQQIVGNSELVKVSSEAVTGWKFRPIREKGVKAIGVTYVGFHFIKEEGVVAISFPFGKWKQQPPSQPETHKEPAANRTILSSGVVAGKRLRGANPIYPDSAKHDRIQGLVLLRATIDKQGHISLLEIRKSPSRDLAIAAIEAVKTWEYRPYTLLGEPVEVETTIQINFTLSG